MHFVRKGDNSMKRQSLVAEIKALAETPAAVSNDLPVGVSFVEQGIASWHRTMKPLLGRLSEKEAECVFGSYFLRVIFTCEKEYLIIPLKQCIAAQCIYNVRESVE